MAEITLGNGVNTICFDLDGTLRHNRPSFIEALTNFILQLGLPLEIANSRQAHRWLHYYWAQSPDLITDRDTFGEDELSFWNNHSYRYLLASGCQPVQAAQLAPELTKCMQNEYTPEDKLADKVPSLLQNLNRQGFRLAVISNRRNPFEEQLEALGIITYFEYSLAAGTIDTWKPDPQIFRHALEAMDVKAEQAIYVGDNYFADVIGAQNAGMQAVLVDPGNLFPEANCVVIDKISALENVLTEQHPPTNRYPGTHQRAD